MFLFELNDPFSTGASSQLYLETRKEITYLDFRKDRATVPLFFENRIPELQLSNENFKEDLENLIEQAELDDEQEMKLEREFAREYHLITRDDRLEKVAEDLVALFMGREQAGKGMVICIDKATAGRCTTKCGSTGEPILPI